MKHVVTISKHLPAKALLDDHPDLVDSIKGFFEDPIGTIQVHFDKDDGDPM